MSGTQPSPVQNAASAISGRLGAFSPVQKIALMAGVVIVAGVVTWMLPGSAVHREARDTRQQDGGGEIGRPFTPIASGRSTSQPPNQAAPTVSTQAASTQATLTQAASASPFANAGMTRPAPPRPTPIMAYVAPGQQQQSTEAAGAAALAAERARTAATDPYAAPDFAESKVKELADPDWLIEQGRQIPCIQQTKLNTTFGGPVTAMIPVDVRGSTGRVILLDRGAEVFGTIEKGIVNGLDRAFVLWRQITTTTLYDATGNPHKYRVRVDSPAADELGQTGLDGDVNRHIVSKFGGVVALSLIQGGMQALANSTQGNNRGNGNQSFNFNSFSGNSEQLATTLLQSTINIPDVLTRNQGQSCTLFIARDLNLKGAYRLERR